MFTGITQGLCDVKNVVKEKDRLTYQVQLTPHLADGLKTGASVSIDGVCQTIIAHHQGLVTFQAIKETLEKTTLKFLHVGQKVSVERSVKLGDEVGGHFISGHVWETGVVNHREKTENNEVLQIKCSSECLRFIFPKGFIALEGSSLTVVKVNKQELTFEISLIPETLRWTNLGNKRVGEPVNIEVDSQAVALWYLTENYFKEQVKALPEK